MFNVCMCSAMLKDSEIWKHIVNSVFVKMSYGLVVLLLQYHDKSTPETLYATIGEIDID